jgi:hypothetical protein
MGQNESALEQGIKATCDEVVIGSWSEVTEWYSEGWTIPAQTSKFWKYSDALSSTMLSSKSNVLCSQCTSMIDSLCLNHYLPLRAISPASVLCPGATSIFLSRSL